MTTASVRQTDRDPALDKDWWRGAVIYQVYPRSFQDSTGNGVGDLRGIIRRLPYIASLGVDALWVSPFFTSPMKDFGYDVSNYRDVDPMFGSLGDFEDLLDTAHRLGLKVMIDLVLSHTSDRHPWFLESRSRRENAKSDWYVWSDAAPDGTPPNNWLSIFGGSAWQWDPRREQYFLHNFLTSQPDLNFHTPAVQDALLDVARFWLARGVDGFRLDTINFYVHDALLRPNPALPRHQQSDTIAPSVNPYNSQIHLYDRNRPENLDFLRRFRAVLEEYDAKTALGEVGDAQLGLEILGQYTGSNDKVHMCYAFEFLSSRPVTASLATEVFQRLDRVAGDGWVCWAFSNHDVARHASRWQLSPAAQRLMTTLIMCLRGSVCIYQGEELGLGEADIEFSDLKDPYGVEFWPEFKGRDGCRTPMVWDREQANGGFSTAEKTWLPVPSIHLGQAAAQAEGDADALLHHYRRAIAFRSHNIEFQKGSMAGVSADGNILNFCRNYESRSIFCAFNIGDTSEFTKLPSGSWAPIGEELETGLIGANGKIKLDPWQACFARRID